MTGASGLDPPVEVALHHVGRADEEALALALAEAKMRECSRYRPTTERTRMVSLTPGTPGTHRAHAADDEVDGHAGLAGAIERRDDARDRRWR